MLIEDYHKPSSSKQKSVATIGVFDGIHKGHQYLLYQVIEYAKTKEQLPVVVTFSPHPQSILSSNPDSIKFLSTLDERIEYFRKIGIQKVILCQFTREFSLIHADVFLETLINNFQIDTFILGTNHTFGYQKSGNVDTFPQLAKTLNIEIHCIPPLQINGKPVSSSYIRNLLIQQKVEEAEIFLGRPYNLSGYVVRGEQRGKTLGFPTANIHIEPENRLIPADGVYCGLATTDRLTNVPALISIGNRPTFGNLPKAIEVYIINFSEILYGKHIQILFKRFIRNQITFQNSDDLIQKMKEDEHFACTYFGLH
ncbi:MAG: riboflavin biosynthesis protein RibF [bacterium]|nr:riboflavin biosynthesis protein RibF [bacterium]